MSEVLVCLHDLDACDQHCRKRCRSIKIVKECQGGVRREGNNEEVKFDQSQSAER